MSRATAEYNSSGYVGEGSSRADGANKRDLSTKLLCAIVAKWPGTSSGRHVTCHIGTEEMSNIGSIFWTLVMAYVFITVLYMCGYVDFDDGPAIDCYQNNRHPRCIE